MSSNLEIANIPEEGEPVRESENPAQRRQHPRYPTKWPALCEAAGVGMWPVTIINASEGGFGLSRDLPVEVGAELTIRISEIGDFPCALVWKREDRCGVRLLRAKGSFSDDQISGLAAGLAIIA